MGSKQPERRKNGGNSTVFLISAKAVLEAAIRKVGMAPARCFGRLTEAER
jgi:hypothetical protein